ncbi:MAG: HlyD family efflux transporter periplasmic adaptor subunit [Pirellulaceae bacterium]
MLTARTFSILALATVAGSFAAAAQAQPSSSGRRTVEVKGALVTLIDDVRVPAQEAGRLMKVMVKGGEIVPEGFVLAEIDNRDTIAKEKIAQGEYEVALATAASTAELEVAEYAVEVSKAEYDSNLEIREKNAGAVSLTELRKFKFQWQRALAQVKVAKSDLNVANLTTKIKEAQLEATANELARRQIKAPFQGEVNEVFRQVGEWVQPGEPIAYIVRFDRVRVKGFVYAKSASPVELIGKPVEITVISAGGKEKKVQGRIDFASSIIEGSGELREFRIWSEIDNEKYVDPVTKKEAWTIQPGASADMVIDLTPPPPAKLTGPLKANPVKAKGTKAVPAAPAAAPSVFRPRSSLSTSGSDEKVESLKPVSSEPASKPRVR